MAGLRSLPLGAQFWPERATHLDVPRLQRMYEAGFAGAYGEPQEEEQLLGSLPYPDGEQVAHDFGLAGGGAGKLSLPYIYAYKHWPKVWPSPPQRTGNCVARAGKNCAIVLIGVEVATGKPDEVTGQVEGFPEVSDEGEKQGVVVWENMYGDRGHSGQGASCSRLQTYVTTKGGILLRKNYPNLHRDFTVSNTQLGINWGRTGTPSDVNVEGQKHQIRTATKCGNHENARDFIASGYPVWACSSLGWSSQRDENGYARQRGKWMHSWIVMGYDDRPETVRQYRNPLALLCHDWGVWNTGGRRILGTDMDIPEGAWWADAPLLDQCNLKAMSSMDGWKPRQLPDYGGSLLG